MQKRNSVGPHGNGTNQPDGRGSIEELEASFEEQSAKTIARDLARSISHPDSERNYAEHVGVRSTWQRYGGIKAVKAALVDLLADADALTRLGAATWLLIEKTAIAKAAAAYARLMEDADADVRLKTLMMLAFCESHAVCIRESEALFNSLNKLMSGTDTLSNVYAAACLADSPAPNGSTAPLDAIRVLSKALTRKDPQTVLIAAGILGRMGVYIEEAVKALSEMLADGTPPEIRTGAISVLSQMGENTQAALPTLLNLLVDPQIGSTMRKFIAQCLGGMGMGEDAKRALRKAAKSKDWQVVCSIAECYKDFDDLPDWLLAPLVQLLSHADKEARGMAAVMIGDYGRLAAGALPAMVERVANETEPSVLYNLSKAFHMINHQLSTLDQAFVDSAVDRFLHRATIQDDPELSLPIAGSIASFRGYAIPTLIAAAIAGKTVPRQVAVAALGLISLVDADAVVRAISDQLFAHRSRRVRLTGVSVFVEMGPLAANAVPELVRLLDDSDETAVAYVLRCLRAIGRPASQAAPSVAPFLLAGDHEIRTIAEDVVAGFGRDAAAALSNLASGLDDADDRKSRIVALLKRLELERPEPGSPEPQVAEPAESLDFSRAKIAWLRTFAVVGRYLLDHGATGFKEIARQLKGSVHDDFPTTDQGIRGHIVKLEKCLNNPPVQLILRSSHLKTNAGLSNFGKEILPNILEYINSKHIDVN